MTDAGNALLEQLYAEMASKLRRYANQTLNNRSLAEEAVQIAFIEACEKEDSLLSSSNPRGWIINAVKHVVRRIITQQIKDNDILIRSDEYGEWHAGAHHSDELDTDILYEDLKNDADYLLLKKYTEERCSVRDLADELGISIETCRKRLQRARARLQKFFEKNQN